MAITYPRTLPASPGIKKNRFGITVNFDVWESPITHQKQFLDNFGDRWEGVFQFPPLTSIQAREWKAWFASMKGPIKKFYAYDPDIRTPEGIADVGSDTPLVFGASQTGNTLLTDGWRFTGSGLLLPGDHFNVGAELKMVTETLDSDGAGGATISFEPPLRVAPTDNAPIVFENPKGEFRIVGDSVPWESNEFGITTFAFAFEEAI